LLKKGRGTLETCKFWLLDINYEVKDHKPEVWLWGIDENGRRVLVIDKSFQPYFYAVLKDSEDPRKLYERMMDVITALSGCAPAYLSFMIKAASEACVKEGLPEEIALVASAQSLIGTGKLLLEGELSVSEIIEKVATPGGVTEEELKEMNRLQIAENIESAIRAGIEKSRRISEELNRSLTP